MSLQIEGIVRDGVVILIGTKDEYWGQPRDRSDPNATAFYDITGRPISNAEYAEALRQQEAADRTFRRRWHL